MKKLIFIAAAVAAMAACTKSQVVYDDTENEIGITPVSDKATKALYGPVKDAVYPEGESFGVFAQHSTAAAGETFATGSGELNDYLVNVEFVYDSTTASDADGKKWHGKTPYYWPKTGSLYFAGYSPYSITAGTRDYDFTRTAPKLTIADFVQGGYNYKDGSATVPGGNAGDSYQMVDLLWFDATASSANTGAPAVIFKHALSYITIKLDVSTGLDNLFYLKSVKLSNIEMKADFDSNPAAGAEEWSGHESTAELELYSGNQVLSSTTPFVIDDILIIPQTTSGSVLTITYGQKAAADTPEIEQTYTLSNILGGDEASTPNDTDKWLMGKHYTYLFTFTADEIKLTPSVEIWSEISRDYGTIK